MDFVPVKHEFDAFRADTLRAKLAAASGSSYLLSQLQDSHLRVSTSVHRGPCLLPPLLRDGEPSQLCAGTGCDDEGRAELRGHQPRSTGAICGGVAARRGSEEGLTRRCKQSTFMAAPAASARGSRTPTSPQNHRELRFSPVRTRKAGCRQRNAAHTGSRGFSPPF